MAKYFLYTQLRKFNEKQINWEEWGIVAETKPRVQISKRQYEEGNRQKWITKLPNWKYLTCSITCLTAPNPTLLCPWSNDSSPRHKWTSRNSDGISGPHGSTRVRQAWKKHTNVKLNSRATTHSHANLKDLYVWIRGLTL